MDRKHISPPRLNLTDIYLKGLHTPVVHIPAFTGEHGLPVGLSVVAGRYQDQYLLKICSILGEPLMAEGGWNIISGRVSAGSPRL